MCHPALEANGDIRAPGDKDFTPASPRPHPRPGRGLCPIWSHPLGPRSEPESAPRPACTASQAGSLRTHYCQARQPSPSLQLTILGAAQAPLSLSSVASLLLVPLIVTLKMVTLHVMQTPSLSVSFFRLLYLLAGHPVILCDNPINRDSKSWAPGAQLHLLFAVSHGKIRSPLGLKLFTCQMGQRERKLRYESGPRSF